jgi:hypothetical protein
MRAKAWGRRGMMCCRQPGGCEQEAHQAVSNFCVYSFEYLADRKADVLLLLEVKIFTRTRFTQLVSRAQV